MFILGNLIGAIATTLSMVIGAVEIVIIIWVILSWANADPYNALVRIIGAVTNPILRPFRRLVPPYRLHGLDISPFLAVVLLEFIRNFIVRSLMAIAARLGG